MQKAVLIAEKPSLMRDIEAVYKKNRDKIPYEIEFACFVGHIYKLAPPSMYDDFEGSWDLERLPIIPRWNGFKITLDPSKKELLTKINKVVRETDPDIIINACDPEREGEHIFRLYKDTNLQNFKGEIKRFWCNDLTEKEILKNLINLLDEKEKENLREAAFCRAKSDWLIGMNFTEASTVMFSRGKNATIKVGRVKTPLLNIIYQRELEIRNFKPSSKYQIKAKYKDGFEGTLFDDAGNLEFKTEEECNNYLNNIPTEQHIVKEFSKKVVSTKAPQLYKLSDIQIEAGKKYGYTAAQVLEIMQSLYEKKYTSYPRTDSRYISMEAAKDIPIILKHIAIAFPDLKSYINDIQKEDVITIAQKNTKLCNDKEVAQSGHTALIVTTSNLDLSKLSIEEQNLLKMVCIRLLSHFMQPLKENKIEIITKKDDYTFKATYKTLIDKGYTVLLDKNTNYATLKDITQGSKINVDKIISHEVKATCPSRFTSAELIYAMENPSKYLYNKNDLNKNTMAKIKGIGTQATRAEIINSLLKDGYCTMTGKGNVFTPTDFGMRIMDILNEASFAKVDLTARWEQYLERVEHGSMTTEQYKRLIEDYVKEGIDLIKTLKGPTISNISSLKDKCPECGSDVLIGKNFYYCAKYKKDTGCPFLIPQKILSTKITEKDASNLINGKIIEKKLNKDDKSWNQKLQLNNNKLEFVQAKAEKVGECPCCGGDVVKNSWGYGCSEYKNGCKFGISNEIAGKKLSKKIIWELLEYGETSNEVKGFTSKKGNEFNARLYIDENYRVSFKFE